MFRKRLPIGVSDFKKLIKENYYYIDKTNFIEEILEKRSEVTLLCRPRRFGKTLNLSTLRYFLDMNNAVENRELFKGLNIEKSKYMLEQGRYSVVSLNMKDLKIRNFEEFFKGMKSKMSNLFDEHQDIRGRLNSRDLKKFDKIWFQEEEGDYERSLSFLLELIFKYYKQRPILLIDEYDTPTIQLGETESSEEIQEFIDIFYSSALKDGVVEFAVIVGVFKNLNNVKSSTILSEDFEHFGFLESEVKDILKYYSLDITLNETKKWYNGYIFGKEKVYNPWSILNHCDTWKLEKYWAETTCNKKIKELLKNSNKDVLEVFSKLLKNEKVEFLLSENTIFKSLFFAGYLTVENEENENKYYLKIPNYELKKYFSDIFEFEKAVE